MKSANPITVLLAEDHTIVREGLRKLLESDNITVVGEAATGRLAVTMALKLRPSVIIMDIAMPLLNGLEATRQIRHAIAGARILILSAHSDDAYVEKMKALGAAGYLVKQTSGDLLCKAVREVHQGKSFFSDSIARRADKRQQNFLDRKGLPKASLAELSPRETEVLQMIAEGQGNKQIAAELGISIKTAEKHREHLMRKLDIHDTASLTRYAISAGIIDCDVPLTIL
jgi:DNA-binding NarL/FixJ family response regulator